MHVRDLTAYTEKNGDDYAFIYSVDVAGQASKMKIEIKDEEDKVVYEGEGAAGKADIKDAWLWQPMDSSGLMENLSKSRALESMKMHTLWVSIFGTLQILKRVSAPSGCRKISKGYFTRDRRPKLEAHYMKELWEELPDYNYK